MWPNRFISWPMQLSLWDEKWFCGLWEMPGLVLSWKTEPHQISDFLCHDLQKYWLKKVCDPASSSSIEKKSICQWTLLLHANVFLLMTWASQAGLVGICNPRQPFPGMLLQVPGNSGGFGRSLWPCHGRASLRHSPRLGYGPVVNFVSASADLINLIGLLHRVMALV